MLPTSLSVTSDAAKFLLQPPATGARYRTQSQACGACSESVVRNVVSVDRRDKYDMSKRPWRQFEVRHAGKCEIEIGSRTLATSYEVGLVETGKQKVFAGIDVRIVYPSGGTWIGHDDWSPVEALRSASALAAADGARIICAGLSMFFTQSGLSWATPYGFYPWSSGPVHMMSPPEAPIDGDTDPSQYLS